jgi:hypothetical protein
MAVLKFTAKDKMASKVMPDGYYSFEVVDIAEPTKSSTGKSFNLHSRFRVIDDPTFEGKELKIAFNTNMDSPSVMGTMFLMPHNMIPHLAAAVGSIDLDDVPEELDTVTLKGGKFDAKVHKTIAEGIPVNTMSNFIPYGSGKEAEQVPF